MTRLPPILILYHYCNTMNLKRTGDRVATRDYLIELREESECYRGGHGYRFTSILLRICIFRPSWVKVEGITCRNLCALLMRIENEYPLFGSLGDMFVNDRVFFRSLFWKLYHFHRYMILFHPQTLKLYYRQNLISYAYSLYNIIR